MLKSRLCGCIAGETPAAFVRIAKAAKEKGVGLVELRLDYLKTAAGLEKAIRAMRSLGLDIIAINRLKKDGGRFSGSERRRTALLLRAIDAGCDFVDLEVGMGKELRAEMAGHARANGCKVIGSAHFMHSTPSMSVMRKTLAKEMSFADIGKIVSFANSMTDCVRMMNLLDAAKGQRFPLISFCMGELGSFTRITA